MAPSQRAKSERPRCSLIRRWIGSSPRCRSSQGWMSCDWSAGALRGARDGHGRVGSGGARRRAHDHGGGAQARSPGRRAQAPCGVARRLRGQVPGRVAPGRVGDPRRGRGRRERPVHRSAGAAPAGAMKPPSRTLTTLAVGFLSLDALLLGYAAIASRRPLLALGGGACALAAALVVLAWRRYRRTLLELDAARREMRREVESIRELLGRHHLNN